MSALVLSVGGRSAFADPARLEAVKWLAVLAMICDHVAIVLLPEQSWLREIGAFAFPAFSLAFGVGLAASSNPLRVGLRLLLPAAIAQACWIVLDAGPAGPNILFLFAACALAVAACRSATVPLTLCLLSIVVLTVGLRIEGGLSGLLLVVGGFLAARRAFWWVLPPAALWLALVPSVGALLALLAVLFAPRLPFALPRKSGALAWVYVAHLLGLALIAGGLS